MTYPGNPILPAGTSTVSKARQTVNDAAAALSAGALCAITKLTFSTTITAVGVYICDATSGPITITLPPAIKVFGLILVIKTDATGNAVTIQRHGADTIEGATSLTTSTQYEKLGVFGAGLTGVLFKSPGQDG